MNGGLETQLLNSVAGKGWKTIGVRHHHGFSVFLSALRSETSRGIGEYLDLIPMIDWCQQIGMDIIQLLPLNDSGLDPSPYNAVSSCALHPIYLKINALPYLDEFPALQKTTETLTAYNALPHIAYHDVLMAKMQWLQAYLREVGPRFVKSPEFQEFKSTHPWLETYALFKTLLAKFNHTSWEMWPDEYRNLTSSKEQELLQEYEADLLFYSLIQYLCFCQLSRVRHHADRKGIFLKGDLPILISRNSADVWHNPQFFNLNLAAGHPADQFSTEGQYWGFPLFNWENLERFDYQFWRERIQAANYFYHAYRIDHAVGFFRIWGIPLHQPPSSGRFIPDDPREYLPQGVRLLSVLATTSSMLPIAEDLGAVPKEVRACLSEMGIAGTRVMRWEVDWTKEHPYIDPQLYSPISMSCVSTHDSETLSQWWQTDPQQASLLAQQKSWKYAPEITHQQLKELLWDSHHSASLFHINLLQEYLSLFPELVAANPAEERINVPGTLLATNWTYRYHTSIEIIVNHKDLISSIQEMVKA